MHDIAILWSSLNSNALYKHTMLLIIDFGAVLPAFEAIRHWSRRSIRPSEQMVLSVANKTPRQYLMSADFLSTLLSIELRFL
jgi:hypothetical protein